MIIGLLTAQKIHKDNSIMISNALQNNRSLEYIISEKKI
jgi:hypothetical protein